MVRASGKASRVGRLPGTVKLKMSEKVLCTRSAGSSQINCASRSLPRPSVSNHIKDDVAYRLSIMQPLLHQASFSSSLTSGIKSLHTVKHVGQRQISLTSPVSNRKPLVPQAKKGADSAVQDKPTKGTGLGDLLGPIGLSLGKSDDKQDKRNGNDRQTSNSRASSSGNSKNQNSSSSARDSSGPELGPIALSFGGSSNALDTELDEGELTGQGVSIHSMTTDEWQQAYEADGYVDLWVEEEFNSGSRLVGGRDVHKGGVAGFGSGEGQSAGVATRHRVKIFNHHADQEVEVEVPEDRYILWEAEEQGLLLPYACRMGCCTACAVRIKEGNMYQPQSLGVSAELKEAGYALMCVGYPRSDLVLETVEEDEVYDLQFGRSFAEQAVDPSNRESIERDDWALEIANMDE